MRSLHLEKKGLRCLAIAESFRKDCGKSILSGIVMRQNLVIDGFVLGTATLGGDDATDAILKMYDDLQRPDVNYVLISGLIVSMYNIIDIKKIHSKLQIPVIGVTYHESSGMQSILKHRFPNSFESKITAYERLGPREKIALDTLCNVFIRKEGCTTDESRRILNDLTLQGSIPEPLRISKLIAKTLLQKGLSF